MSDEFKDDVPTRDVREDVSEWTAGDPPRKRAPAKKKKPKAEPNPKQEDALKAIDESLRTLAEAITPPPEPERPSPPPSPPVEPSSTALEEPVVHDEPTEAEALVAEPVDERVASSEAPEVEEPVVRHDERTVVMEPVVPEPSVLQPAPRAEEPSIPVATSPPPPVFEEPPIESFVFEESRAPEPAAAPMRRGIPRNLSRKRFAALETFAEALIPRGGPVPPGASDVGVAGRVDASLTRLDPEVRRRFEQLIAAIDLSPVPSRLKRLGSMDQARASAWLAKAQHSKNPLLRQATALLKTICLNEYASTPEVEAAVGFTYSCESPDPARDGPPLEVITDIDRDHVEECDVVVVGSGAGGATVAKELAEGGLSVVVLEEGDYFTRNDFAGPPWERLQRMYRANGTTVALGKPVIPLPMGKAIGGTTLVNSGSCFRTPDRVLERWGSEFGIDGIDPHTMRPIFDRVEKLLHVKPVSEQLIGENARVFRRGVDKLGLHGAPMLRNIQGCRGCGVCAFGCPSDAKQSTHLSYLPRAQRAGATIFGRSQARRILVEAGRAAGVVADVKDAKGGKKATLTVRAKAVVLACGAIPTPSLLMQNALANRSGMLGRNLRIHPAAGVGAFFDEDVYSWRGTLQPYYVDNWHESQDVMIEVTSSVPSVAAGSFPGMGLELKHMLGRFPQLASAGLFVSDTSSGRVRARKSGEPLVTYHLNETDTRKVVRGIITIAEIFFAAGANQVYLGLPRTGLVTSTHQLEEIREEAIKPGALKLTAFHPAGTARMGADPATTVVDPWGEAHDVPGLFVSDASMLPGCPTVNPQITIMAFATRTAQHMLRTKASYFA